MSDYLWDKEGTDEEVEALEFQLSRFRLDTELRKPLPLPAEVESYIPFWRRPFLIFAAPAFAAVLIGMFVLGGLFSRGQVKTDAVVVENTAPVEVEKRVQEPAVAEKPTQFEDKRRIARVQNRIASKPAPVKIRFKKTPVILAKKSTPALKPVRNDEEITPEEQDAYDELMRALTITSSKLRLVKDKVDGSEVTKKSR